MQKYQSTITATNGSVIRNVPVTVIKEDGSLAEIFMDREGQVQASNPLVTDSRGVFYFYAKNGRYSLRTAADGVQITDVDTVLLFDPDETASDGPIADAVRRAEDAAERAETALSDSGLQDMVQDAQDAAANAAQAVIDANLAVASIDAALIEVSEAKEDAQAAAQTASTAASDAQAVKDSLLNYDGTLSATPEWSAVPAHEDSDLDAQTQAALNRIEKLKDDQQLKEDEVIEAEPSWDDVPKHKSDVFNAQAQALANRTKHLQNTKRTAVDLRSVGAEPGVDCGELLLSLFDSNIPIVVPVGSFVATLSSEADVIKFWANLNKVTTEGNLVVTLPAGKQSIPAAASITSNLSGLSVKGRAPVALSVASVVDVTSDVFTAYDGFGVLQTDWRYHRVTYSLTDASSVSVGDYLHTPWVSGDNSETSGVLAHLGIHEVIAKSGNNITVLISSHYTPSTVFTAMEMQKIPTVLSFATSATFGVPAMVVANGGILGGNTPNDLGGLSDMVLVGKGCAISMADGRGPGGFDAFGQGGHSGVVARDNGRLMAGRNLCFSGWPATSLASSRNSAVNSIYPVTSSMAGRNGYVCSGSSMELQNIVIGGRNYGTIATGSMNDGYENQDNGHMYADYSYSVGNHRTGYSNTGNAYGNFQTGTAIGNRHGGLISDGSHCIFKPGVSNYNTDFGLRAQNRGLINAAGAEVRGNTEVGVFSSDGSEIQFGSGKSYENGPEGTRLDYRALTGGRIEAVYAAVSGYTPTSSPPFNVVGSNGSVVSSATSPTSLSFAPGSTVALTIDSSNTALFGTNGSGYPNGRIKTGGNIVAGGTILHSADNTYPIGLAAYRATLVYAASGTINTSDGREKTAPQSVDDAVLDAWGDVQIICFQWLLAIQQKGEDLARWHFGVIAQQVRDAFEAHGLDGTRYGLLCYDEWDDAYEPIMAVRVNESGEEEEYDTGEKRLVLAAGNRWGIRADQCLFLEAAYQRREMQRLKARVSALEMN